MLKQADLFAAGYSKRVILQKVRARENIKVIFNSAEEIIRCTNFVYDRTSGVEAWRVPDPPDSRPRPNQLMWPGSTRMRGVFLPDDYK